MEKSHESFMINDNLGDHVVFLLMVFSGVFGSTFYWQNNMEWSIADAILSTITFGIGAILMKLMLNYYPVGKIKSWPTILFALIIASLLTFSNQLLWDANWLNYTEPLALFNASLAVRVTVATLLFHLIGFSVLSNKSSTKDFNRLQQEESRQKLSNDAELHYLRQQMQPHFLFNSLNSINALLARDPEKARVMVQGLADFYRDNLKMDPKKWEPVEKEMKSIGQYLKLEKIRFGHRLKYAINLPEKASPLKLPSLMVQTLVENAVKHGLYGVTGDVLIRIDVSQEGNDLLITVQNPCDDTSGNAPGTGFGLESLHRRLFLVFGRKDLLTHQVTAGQFTATLKIPQIQ
ncbi:histidine kinase [uncultured Cyclobacterium sp.]|uniref:sensor histidine kinase n=1 Tax=uncultured Cyclobacterium sp. TaxID=453820 RepID=UPI0030ECC4A2|tara:strand:- start:259155 stop:260198 length:1044 start_codon:yes stop_codon:yes gene_type:complete